MSKGAPVDRSDPRWDGSITLDIVKDSPSREKNIEIYQLNSLQEQVSSPVRREIASRSNLGMKSPSKNNDVDVESGRLENSKEKTVRSKRVITLHNQALLSGLAYCFSSCSMILVNKILFQ